MKCACAERVAWNVRCGRDMSDKRATCHLQIDVRWKTHPNRRTAGSESGACPLAESRDAGRHHRPWISQSEVEPANSSLSRRISV
jgi:hypothetical protein